MGSDFCRKAAPTFKKSWDEGKLHLSQPDLFTRMTVCEGRAVPFSIANKKLNLSQGDKLIVQQRGKELIATQGINEIARTDSPPDYVLKTIERSCGIANGTIHEIHPISGKVEISIC